MPYIAENTRNLIDKGWLPNTAGELNYTVTKVCDTYLQSDLSYSTINEIIGVLECVKLELYRRIAAPYEDSKLRENGDVYSTKVD